MQVRTKVHSMACIAGGIALVLGGTLLRPDPKRQAEALNGVQVVTGTPFGSASARGTSVLGTDATSAIIPRQTSATAEEAGAHVKRYGELPIATDALLDTAIAAAPDVIGVRHRLFAMQWAGGRDPTAEHALQTRMASLANRAPDRIRVRCSVTTCEVATGDPALAPRLSALVTANRDDSVASCPLLASNTVNDTWSDLGTAVAYVARGVC